MNLGKSKSDTELEVMANAIKDFDVITIQEVVAGREGVQAVSRLVSILNKKGTKWDSAISEVTTSDNPSSRERYAFIWKSSKIKKLGKCWLDQNYEKEIDREPFMGTFSYKGRFFTLVSFHAVPKKKNPEKEIKYFKFYPKLYSKLNLIFMGDFNCSQSHTVFNPLKSEGFNPILINQKTSLRQKCIKNDCLASEYDNLFYDSKQMFVTNKGVVSFYKNFNSVKEARKISDHLPIWCNIDFK
jgi:endonuclease/exonuclease/phosphatase family metal-dependent hydrolase